MKIQYNYKLILLVWFLSGIIFGYQGRLTFFPEKVQVIREQLPLENQGNIELKIMEGKKIVVMSLEDFQYITKKRRRTKSTVKKLEGLFERLE